MPLQVKKRTHSVRNTLNPEWNGQALDFEKLTMREVRSVTCRYVPLHTTS